MSEEFGELCKVFREDPPSEKADRFSACTQE